MGSPKAGRTPASPSRPTNPTGEAGRLTPTTRQDAEARQPSGQRTQPASRETPTTTPSAPRRASASCVAKDVARCASCSTRRWISFDSRGYHATRVNDVVEIAKTSHGTFYLYFANKEDVLRALVNEAATEVQSLYDALNNLPAEGRSPAVGGRPRLGTGLLRVVDPVRTAVPGLDRPGNDRSRSPGRHPRYLYGAIRCADATDRPRLVRPHHRSRSGGIGHPRHARPIPLSAGIRSTTDRRRGARDRDDDGVSRPFRSERLIPLPKEDFISGWASLAHANTKSSSFPLDSGIAGDR